MENVPGDDSREPGKSAKRDKRPNGAIDMDKKLEKREKQRRSQLAVQADENRIKVADLQKRQSNALEDAFGGSDGDAKNRLLQSDKEHRFRIVKQINRDYRAKGNTYYSKGRNGDLKAAFKDKGKKIVTKDNDERVAFAVVAMAQAKGWKAVNVKGHKEFRSMVWLEAKARGIEVHGYKPSEAEKIQLADRLEAKGRYKTRNKTRSSERGNTVSNTEKKAIVTKVASDVRNPVLAERIVDKITAKMEQSQIKKAVPVFDKDGIRRSKLPEINLAKSRDKNKERVR